MWNPTTAWARYIQHISPELLAPKAFDARSLAAISTAYQQAYNVGCKKVGAASVRTRVVQSGVLYRVMNVHEPWLAPVTEIRLIPTEPKEIGSFLETFPRVREQMNMERLPTDVFKFVEGNSMRYSNFEYRQQMHDYVTAGMITTRPMAINDVAGWAHVLCSYHAAIYIKIVRCEPYGFDPQTAAQLSWMLNAPEYEALRTEVFAVMRRENPHMFPTEDALAAYLFVIQQMIIPVQLAMSHYHAHVALMQMTEQMPPQAIQPVRETQDQAPMTQGGDDNTPTSSTDKEKQQRREIAALRAKVDALAQEKDAVEQSLQVARASLDASRAVVIKMQRAHEKSIREERRKNAALQARLRPPQQQQPDTVTPKEPVVLALPPAMPAPEIQPQKEPDTLTMPMAVWWLKNAVAKKGKPVCIGFSQPEITHICNAYRRLPDAVKKDMDRIADSVKGCLEKNGLAAFNTDPQRFVVAADATMKLLQENDAVNDASFAVYRVMVLAQKLASTWDAQDTKETFETRIIQLRVVLLNVLNFVAALKESSDVTLEHKQMLLSIQMKLFQMLCQVYQDERNLQPVMAFSLGYVMKIIDYYEKHSKIFDMQEIKTPLITIYLSELEKARKTTEPYDVSALKALADWLASAWVIRTNTMDIAEFNKAQLASLIQSEKNRAILPAVLAKIERISSRRPTAEDVDSALRSLFLKYKTWLIGRADPKISENQTTLLSNLTKEDRNFYQAIRVIVDKIPPEQHLNLAPVIAHITGAMFSRNDASGVARYLEALIHVYENDNTKLKRLHFDAWVKAFDPNLTEEGRKAAIKSIFVVMQAITPRVMIDSFGLVTQFLMLFNPDQRAMYYVDRGILVALTTLITDSALNTLVTSPHEYEHVLNNAEKAFVADNILCMPDAELKDRMLVRSILLRVIERYLAVAKLSEDNKVVLAFSQQVLALPLNRQHEAKQLFATAFPDSTKTGKEKRKLR